MPVLSAAVLLAAAAPASSLTIDFEEFSHGDIVALSSGSHAGYTLTVDRNRSGLDPALAFDTGVGGNATASADADLEVNGGYDFGNIAAADPGNILIIQENDDCDLTAMVCFEPDDEGRRPAGTLLFEFTEEFASFSIDLIDIDNPVLEVGSITFLRDGAEIIAYSFADFLDGPFASQGVEYGNHSANHVDILPAQFDGPVPGIYDAVRIALGGSGGIDNLDTGIPVPEPTTAALLGLGLSGLLAAASRRRRP